MKLGLLIIFLLCSSVSYGQSQFEISQFEMKNQIDIMEIRMRRQDSLLIDIRYRANSFRLQNQKAFIAIGVGILASAIGIVGYSRMTDFRNDALILIGLGEAIKLGGFISIIDSHKWFNTELKSITQFDLPPSHNGPTFPD